MPPGVPEDPEAVLEEQAWFFVRRILRLYTAES